MYINFIALLYVLRSRTAHVRALDPLLEFNEKYLKRRFGALTGRPQDLMKNLETPGKTGRVGRHAYRFRQYIQSANPFVL